MLEAEVNNRFEPAVTLPDRILARFAEYRECIGRVMLSSRGWWNRPTAPRSREAQAAGVGI
jgi:hypothetical protein